MKPWAAVLVAGVALAAMSGCALRSRDVLPERADPAEFQAWTCSRIDDESDRVQREAAHVAYAFDERAGNNVIAMGLGVTVFWPALLAMRPVGLDAQALAALKGRHEALRSASAAQACPPVDPSLSAERAASLPVAVGERLVYEQRATPRATAQEHVLQIAALRRDEIEMLPVGDAQPSAVSWLHDLRGNLKRAPQGLIWPQLLRQDLALGGVISGEIVDAADAQQRARVRGQVVALGPQTVAGRRFEAAVIDLFGDATASEGSARLDGVLVLDRSSGVLLRMDLFGPAPHFAVLRRLKRIEKATP
jgi:hypothetical protein